MDIDDTSARRSFRPRNWSAKEREDQHRVAGAQPPPGGVHLRQRCNRGIGHRESAGKIAEEDQDCCTPGVWSWGPIEMI